MNLKIPFAATLAIGLLVFLSIGIRGWDASMHGCSREESRQVTQKPPPSEIQYVQDTTWFGAYRDEIRATVGDSLRRRYTLQLAAKRGQAQLYDTAGRFTGYKDTLRDTVCLAGADVREDMILDSAEKVRGDSARDVLAECEFDKGILIEKIDEGPPLKDRAKDAGAGVLAAILIFLGIEYLW